MKTLILGGVRSGKSRLAESLALASGQQVIYIATASAGDEEMKTRIALHKKNRPTEWIIVEEPIKLATALLPYFHNGHCIIIDCLTLWLTNLLLHENQQCLRDERQALDNTLETCTENIIIVSNETGLGIMPLGELTRRYGDEAGIMNQSIAAICDRVILSVAGLPLTLKGNPL